jgi:hypothetical protein
MRFDLRAVRDMEPTFFKLGFNISVEGRVMV